MAVLSVMLAVFLFYMAVLTVLHAELSVLHGCAYCSARLCGQFCVAVLPVPHGCVGCSE